MTGFTANLSNLSNLSNLPPGVTDRDIDRRFGERVHHERCPQHDSWRPDREDLMGVAYEMLNVYDEEMATWSLTSPARIRKAIEELRGVLEAECQCDQLAQAYAEDAAEHAQEEDEGR